MKIYEFKKNIGEKIIIQISEFRGNKLIDFLKANVAKEDWLPTKRGISIRIDLIPELRKGLDKAQKAWKKK